MAMNSFVSRRLFLTTAGAASAAQLLARTAPVAMAAMVQAACDARDDEARFRVLDASDAGDFAAIAARIIPTTDTPGATEAGVIHFFDQAFATEMAGSLAFALEGLADLNRALPARFAELPPEAQDAALAAVESRPYFELLRVMTIFGFFSMERYGGNRDHVGWDVIGFEGHHGGWQYPFGYYDAEAARDGVGEADGYD
ncbi:MAG TPA: gluconate 2-dehydrogenase subunit 3 family protein [Woeseiaceae bacterium]|nr:gluconate 2-dehydrogenase subunit 3 family protein [Woeseiaceae bacterium]